MTNRPNRRRATRVALLVLATVFAAGLAAPALAAASASSAAPGHSASPARGTNRGAATAPTPHTVLTDVSCTSDTFCLAVGAYAQQGRSHPLVERWNGRTWTVAASSAPSAPAVSALKSVVCTRATFCLIAAARPGESPDRAMTWNGSVLRPVDVQGNPEATLADLDCADAAHCSMVGSVGKSSATWVWTGTEWLRSNVPHGQHGATFTSVSCPSTSTCLASGFRGTSAVLIRRGATYWSTRVLTGAPSHITLTALDCVRAYTCTVLGASDRDSASIHHLFVGNLLAGRWAARLAPIGSLYPTPMAVSCSSIRRCTGTVGAIGVNDDADGEVIARGATGAFHVAGRQYPKLGGASCTGTRCEVVGATLADQRGSGTIFNEPSSAIALGVRNRTVTSQSPPSLPR